MRVWLRYQGLPQVQFLVELIKGSCGIRSAGYIRCVCLEVNHLTFKKKGGGGGGAGKDRFDAKTTTLYNFQKRGGLSSPAGYANSSTSLQPNERLTCVSSA